MTNPNPGKALWPANFQGCTVQGTYVDLNGDPVVGSVEFTPTPAMLLDVTSGVMVVPVAREVILDNNGHFSVIVPATDDPDINPMDWTYQVKEKFDNGRSFSIRAPQNSTVNLVSVSPVPASGGTATLFGPPPFTIPFGYGGTLVTKVGSSKFYNIFGRDLSISKVHTSVGTAPTGATIICDVKKNGTSIFNATPANRPAIAIGATEASAGPADTTIWHANEYITVDIVQVGSTVAGADLVVQVYAV